MLQNSAKLTFFLFVFGLFSCVKDEFITDSSVKLKFSRDTVNFDTMFYSIGSTTFRLKVFNPYEKKVKISSISLLKKENSIFRVNINGLSQTEVFDIELDAKDSLYIFVEVTVPVEKTSFLEEDALIFEVNKNRQEVPLMVFGQDAHFIKTKKINNLQWNNEKPYLICDSLIIEKNQVLRISEGAKIYFQKHCCLVVFGKIIIEGTRENPVVFQGGRLEKMYTDVPGQWDGIFFKNGSKDNFFKHVEVKNAIIGLDFEKNTSAEIANSVIQHNGVASIWADSSEIRVYNSVLADCGKYVISLSGNGKYEFFHCTIANDWYYGMRRTPNVKIDGKNCSVFFGNSIIYGEDFVTSEISFDKEANLMLNYCLLKTDSVIPQGKSVSLMTKVSPKFVDIAKYNFQLDSLSPAMNKGNIELLQKHSFLEFDINGNSRQLDEGPDLGAYEKFFKN